MSQETLTRALAAVTQDADLNNFIKVQQAQQPSAPPVLPPAQRRALGYGPYKEYVEFTIRTHTAENEKATEAATVGLPIIALNKWDKEYMTRLFVAHPDSKRVFLDMYAGAYHLSKGDRDVVNYQAVNAIEALSGLGSAPPQPGDTKKINDFLGMIRGAALEAEKRQGGTRKQSFDVVPLDPAQPGSTLFNRGVKLELPSEGIVVPLREAIREATAVQEQMFARV